MGIKVHIHLLLRQYTNDQDIVEVNGDTVGECLSCNRASAIPPFLIMCFALPLHKSL